MKQKLDHLAIIMDGNARWAKISGKTKAQGHKKGAQVARSLLPHLTRLNIKYLTLYAFSSENWQRPEEEISTLINLLSFYILNQTKILNKYGIKLKIIGNLEKLSSSLQQKIQKSIDDTKHNESVTLCIAFSYGSRFEIINAVQKIIDSDIKQINVDSFKNFLYDATMPDVDLLIRTSGVYRISNFLLWQLAYAELYFTEKYWPDFTINDLEDAINDYSNRQRNFGGR
ncbi:MAG: di-trans,poly-cis-decaprenylcistransferase [Rickettsiales bacterium]|nr:MAG: di-trans,poly-cis-decaprenylcistransferase [Rickettsiales bacterium]